MGAGVVIGVGDGVGLGGAIVADVGRMVGCGVLASSSAQDVMSSVKVAVVNSSAAVARVRRWRGSLGIDVYVCIDWDGGGFVVKGSLERGGILVVLKTNIGLMGENQV